MILDIPDMEVLAILEAMRLTPIYVQLHMPDSEERDNWIPEDFKPHKWQGYENDHCQTIYDGYKILQKAAQEAMRKRGVEVA